MQQREYLFLEVYNMSASIVEHLGALKVQEKRTSVDIIAWTEGQVNRTSHSF
jgi:hypothetical protein